MYTAEYYFVEIVSAILGISYPFIFQIIARIDDKYHSVNLVRLFRKGLAFRLYNILLVCLLILAVCIPWLRNNDSTLAFNWWSIQGIAITIIGFTFFILILLFIEITHYYDPLKLADDIDTQLKRESDHLSRKLVTLRKNEYRMKKFIRASRFSKYWISQYEIDCWNKKIKKYREQQRNIIEEKIPNNLVFKCMTDLLRFSIRDNDVNLYLKLNDLLYWCIIQSNQEN